MTDADVAVPASADPTGSPARVTVLHLRSAGVSLLLRVAEVGPPVVTYWGADLGPLGAASAASLTAYGVGAGVLPEPFGIWPFAPGLELRSGEAGHRPALDVGEVSLLSGASLDEAFVEVGADTAVFALVEPASAVHVDLAIQLTAAGLVRVRAGVTNHGADPIELDGLDVFLPLPDGASHLLDLGGAQLQRSPLGSGRVRIDSSPAGAAPAPLVLGTAGTGFAAGPAWQVHVAFSGGVRHAVRGTRGALYLGGGEQLQPGEVLLGPGEAYHSPWVCWSTADGLDATAARLHRQLHSDPRVEAVEPILFDASGPAFVDHDPAAMTTLAEYAAAVGAEAFCIDLEWCSRVGLDPFTDTDTRGGAGTDDLSGFLGRLRQFDLLVGLSLRWESLLALGGGDAVLELSDRRAMVAVWERLTKLLDRHAVDVLRWSPGPQDPLRPGRHASTLTTYRLLDAVRERYPELVISTQGADLALAHRGGGADLSAEAVERLGRVAALTQVLPPDVVWRVLPDQFDDGTSAAFRTVSGLFGLPVLAMDLPAHSAASLRLVYAGVELHRRVRELIPRGRVFRSDSSDAELFAHGLLAEDAAAAVVGITWSARSVDPRRLRVPGLRPADAYRVEVLPGPEEPRFAVAPAWASGDLVLTGAMLAAVGIPLPAAPRGAALVLQLTFLPEA